MENGCKQWWTLHMFIWGIVLTFLGVYFITTNRIGEAARLAVTLRALRLTVPPHPLLPPCCSHHPTTL